MTRWTVLLLLILSLSLAQVAHADDEVKPLDFCRDYSLIANQIMTARQQDRPMSETISKATVLLKSWAEKYGLQTDMADAEEGAAHLVMAAYEKTVIPIDRLRKVEITDFENTIFKVCYEEATSDSDE